MPRPRAFSKRRTKHRRAATFLLYLGLARYRLKQLDPALIAFQVAVQCDPKLVAAHLALGEAYAERGNDGEALSAYLRALDLEPRNGPPCEAPRPFTFATRSMTRPCRCWKPWWRTGCRRSAGARGSRRGLRRNGNREGAELQFQEALRFRPNSASALDGSGELASEDWAKRTRRFLCFRRPSDLRRTHTSPGSCSARPTTGWAATRRRSMSCRRHCALEATTRRGVLSPGPGLRRLGPAG